MDKNYLSWLNFPENKKYHMVAFELVHANQSLIKNYHKSIFKQDNYEYKI